MVLDTEYVVTSYVTRDGPKKILYWTPVVCNSVSDVLVTYAWSHCSIESLSCITLHAYKDNKEVGNMMNTDFITFS